MEFQVSSGYGHGCYTEFSTLSIKDMQGQGRGRTESEQGQGRGRTESEQGQDRDGRRR